MEVKCTVLFSNNRTHIFTGFWRNVIAAVCHYCEDNGIEAVDASWEPTNINS